MHFTYLFFLDFLDEIEEHVNHFAAFLKQLVALWVFVIVASWNKLRDFYGPLFFVSKLLLRYLLISHSILLGISHVIVSIGNIEEREVLGFFVCFTKEESKSRDSCWNNYKLKDSFPDSPAK